MTVNWKDFAGRTGAGEAVAGTPSTRAGLMYFFRPDNWEVLIKVLDGCPVNNRVWVFIAANTNVEYTVRVVDQVTGRTASYANPLGRLPAAVTDINALAVCGSQPSAIAPPVLEPHHAEAERSHDTTMRLRGGRFQVTTEWLQPNGSRGPARVVHFGSTDSGLFYFFNPNNWEMLVKVLDGCTSNGHFWLFAAAATDVRYTLTVRDLTTQRSKTYTKSTFAPAPTLSDVTALPCATTPPPPPPATVKFRQHVVPLFSTWACISCHTSGHDCPGGPANHGLTLTGTADAIYTEITADTTATGCAGSSRVSTANPPASLIVRKPTGELGHFGGAIWQVDSNCGTPGTAAQQAYCTMLTWIAEGALNN